MRQDIPDGILAREVLVEAEGDQLRLLGLSWPKRKLPNGTGKKQENRRSHVEHSGFRRG